ncbi:DUF3796 domain-containing protein [Clostridioides difficile]|uniref:DUF3796 domain-containing protein n=2 Tax=Clostridioides difficile TaxID=1496 RepID=UPI00016C5FDA|nr:DUF3796 domain-containing protein [Clostridioides difficile]
MYYKDTNISLLKLLRRIKNDSKKNFYGFCGFLGFLSLRYFSSGNVTDLTYIGFFAFFSNFIIAKINGDKADERYVQDEKAAMAFTGQLAIIELFILWCITIVSRNVELMCVLLSITYAITLNVYAIKLYILEEK